MPQNPVSKAMNITNKNDPLHSNWKYPKVILSTTATCMTIMVSCVNMWDIKISDVFTPAKNIYT